MAFWSGRWRIGVSAVVCLVGASAAKANPALVADVDSGTVLYEAMGTTPWYPASLTKLVTTYVALSAVREGRITLDTPLMVSPRAASMAPSKMGFKPGTLVTLDNALKMLLVKSPNDIAVTIAEGVSGSVEDFAAEMNSYAARLGMRESHFVNPNGLPDPAHVSSARDMAVVGRALLREFPEEHDLFGIGELAFGNQLIRNHNGMLGRYPGIDGMKTGYTCSAGFNVVLSAERNGRRLIVVVLGAPSNATRSQRAATLFDRYLGGADGNEGQLTSLPSGAGATAPDLRSVICGRGRGNAIAEAEAEDATAASPPPGMPSKVGVMEVAGTAPATSGPNVMSLPRAVFTPVRVFVGPVEGWTGPIAHARNMVPAPAMVASAPARSRQNVEAVATADKGPIEAPAPAPLALLGATPALPASLVTGAFGKKGKTLSLAVRSPRTHATIHRVDAKLAKGTTPSILAAAEVKLAPASTPELKKKPRPAVKPKPKAKVKPAK